MVHSSALWVGAISERRIAEALFSLTDLCGLSFEEAIDSAEKTARNAYLCRFSTDQYGSLIRQAWPDRTRRCVEPCSRQRAH
jgi:hypothetical protein